MFKRYISLNKQLQFFLGACGPRESDDSKIVALVRYFIPSNLLSTLLNPVYILTLV